MTDRLSLKTCIAAGAAALLLPATAAAQTQSGGNQGTELDCAAEVDAMAKDIRQGIAYTEVQQAFAGFTERARMAALRGDADNCYAFLAKAQMLVSERGTLKQGAALDDIDLDRSATERMGRINIVRIRPRTGYWSGSRSTRAWAVDTSDRSEDIDFYAIDSPREEMSDYREPWAFVARGDGGVTSARAAASVAMLADVRAALVQEIEFPFDSADLTTKAEGTLRRIKNVYEETRRPKVLLTGYASPIGEENYNLALSQDRVAAAREALSDMGIPEENIETRYLGERNPEVQAGENERSAQNRRVEVRILAGRNIPRDLRAELR